MPALAEHCLGVDQAERGMAVSFCHSSLSPSKAVQWVRTSPALCLAPNLNMVLMSNFVQGALRTVRAASSKNELDV